MSVWVTSKAKTGSFSSPGLDSEVTSCPFIINFAEDGYVSSLALIGTVPLTIKVLSTFKRRDSVTAFLSVKCLALVLVVFTPSDASK